MPDNLSQKQRVNTFPLNFAHSNSG